MSRRAIAIYLIVFCFLALVGVLYWAFLPSIRERAIQPAPLPAAGSPAAGDVPVTEQPNVLPSPIAEPAPNTEAFDERQTQEQLKRLAGRFVEQQGSHSSADGFASIALAFERATKETKAFLEAERRKLLEAHPQNGPSWSRTTRALSASIVTAVPVKGKKTVQVTVQAQQIEEAGASNGAQRVSYREYAVELTRTNGEWLVSRIASEELDL